MSGEGVPAAQIKRVNTMYVPAQDRFRLAAEMEDGSVSVMWLSQRILRLVLEPLAKFLQRTPAPTNEQKARRSYGELMHKVSGKGGPPVNSLQVSGEWLIAGLSLKFGPPVKFLFRGEGGEEATMEMDPLKLRKWLGILHRKSIKAGWPAAIWPEAVVAELE